MVTRRDALASGVAALGLGTIRVTATGLSAGALSAVGTGAQAEASASPLIADGAFANLERRSGGRLGVAVLDTGTGRRASWRGAERFAMSSTFKALLAGVVLARVDRGEDALDRALPVTAADLLDYAPVVEGAVGGSLTVDALCEAIVVLSDNAAANLLLATMGGPEGFTAEMRAMGDTLTRLDRLEPDLNEAIPGDPRDTTTPEAMLASLGKLLVDDALTTPSRGRLAGWLAACETGLDRIRAGLPADWQGGDKTGTGSSGNVHDVAILLAPDGGPVLVASYLDATPLSREDAEAIHAELGRLVAAGVGQ